MKLNTCSISSKTKFQTRFNKKLFFFPNSLVCCLPVFLFCIGFAGFCFVFLITESQRAVCHFKEIDYGKPISLYLIAGLEKKTSTASKQPLLKQFISLLYTSNTYLKPISLANYQTVTENNLHLLCITASGCEIQFVFSSEDEVFGSYLKDGWWLQGSSYCKQCKLRRQSSTILPFLVLSMEKLQPSLKIHSLRMRKKAIVTCWRYLKARYFCYDIKYVFFIFLKNNQIQVFQDGIHKSQLTSIEYYCYTPDHVTSISTNKHTEKLINGKTIL